MATSVAAIILAAGRGLRAGGDLPKQYRALAGEAVIRPSLAAFRNHPDIGFIQPVIHPDDIALFESVAGGMQLLPAVFGGATRQASVRAGLEALASSKPAMVLVHDAARPFVSSALISRAIAVGAVADAAIPALEVTDTVKRIDAGGRVFETLDRATLRTVQTPQVFRFA